MKYIYIAGYGRSGSTLLDRVLSSHNDITGVGEVCHFPKYYNKNLLIDEFWTEIGDKLSKKNSLTTIEKTGKRFEIFIFGSILKKIRPVQYKNYKIYTQNLASLITEMDKTKVIVDSSKTAWKQFNRPFILSEIYKAKFTVIFLERNLIDVIKSMRKFSNIKKENNEKNVKMRLPALRAITGYLLAKIFYILYLSTGNKIIRINYCDFCRDPVTNIKKIESVSNFNLDIIKDKITKGEKFGISRQFAGNRMRKISLVHIEKCP